MLTIHQAYENFTRLYRRGAPCNVTERALRGCLNPAHRHDIDLHKHYTLHMLAMSVDARRGLAGAGK